MSRTYIDDLFDALQKGDDRAMEALLPRLRERISHVAKQRLGGARVEDVVQETLTTLWEKRDSIDVPGRVLPFLFRVLRNKIGNAYMRVRREQEREGDRGALEEFPGDPVTDDPGVLFENDELQRSIEKALQVCVNENAVQGRVLLLLFEGRTASEISTELGGTPVSTVRTIIHRGRKRLKEILMRDFKIAL
jgi:RNA polymerase sigma factor (sigma-70 family)